MRRLIFLAFVACGSDSFTNTGGDPNFNVKGVSGLALWLRGDMGVTADGNQLVSVWADQSGNGNDAKESRQGLLPKALAAGINGLPSVHFASAAPMVAGGVPQGNDLSIGDSPTMEWGTGDYLVAVVARYTNDPASKTADGFGALYISIYGPPEGATAGLGLYANVPTTNNNATSSGIEAFIAGQPAAISSGTGYNTGTPHVFAMQRAGTTLSVRIDGASVGSKSVATVDLGKTGARLGGCENAGAQRLEGDMSEVIAVKGTVSASDLSAIEGYLKARYGTP